jgi:alginate O-acetyltransferase complex protein AlgI
MIFEVYPFLTLLIAALAMRLAPPGRPRQIVLALFNLMMLIFVARSYAVLLVVLMAFVWLLVRRKRKLSRGALAIVIAVLIVALLRPKIAHLVPSMKQWPDNLGLSYLVFCLIGLAVDRYRGLVGPVRLADFWNWISFFPSFTAGPIRRFAPLAKQFATGGGENFWWGVTRVIVGIFKRVVLVSLTSPIADYLPNPATRGWVDLVLGTYAYSLNIYLEFSAYTDIAVGAAAMLGYRIEENFRWPYLATNISAFWKRWHMSLTGWLRDYLFIPLGGSRRGLASTTINTVMVMAVIGLWHGFTPNYLWWGLYHAAGLLIYRAYTRLAHGGDRSVHPGRWRRFGAWFLTFHFVTLGWVLFACPLGRAVQVFVLLFTGGR